MSWDYPDAHIETVTVSPGDIDGMGHCNNASYVVWCEQCAWSHSAALGLSIADYQSLDRGVAIQNASYDYRRPSFAGDQLQVGTWLTACDGKLRLRRQFQIIRSSDQATILRGCWNLVCIQVRSGRPSRFPDAFVQTYGAAVIDLS